MDTPPKRRNRFLLWLIISLMLVTLCSPVCYGAEIETLPAKGSCAGILWQLDTDNRQLLFSAIAERETALAGEAFLCWLSFYDTEGRLLSAGVQTMAAEAESGAVAYAAFAQPERYSMKLFFTDSHLTPLRETEEWTFTRTVPTCTKKGYWTLSGPDEATARFCRVTEATGHSYGPWRMVEPAGEVECGVQEHTCLVCDTVSQAALYPLTDFPLLRLEGDIQGISKTTEVPVSAVLNGAGQNFQGYANLKYQGHSSIIYEKKNFTIKFYEDELFSDPAKLTFYNWHKESKYILKANYIDPGKCRNLICAELWYEICLSRDGTKHIKNLFRYGATDGTPMAVYLNDRYIGLYDLTLHKDDDLYDLDQGQYDAMMVLNQSTGPESLFRATATFDEACDWELEFCGREDTDWAKVQLNDFITFVQTASDTDFANKKILKTYVNIDSAIDYLVAIYTLGLTNSAAKNLVLLSYGEDPWICTLYDMENAFGLATDGSSILDACYMLPEQKDGVWDSNTGSLFWDRMLQCYETRIRARYTQLRTEVLSEAHINTKAAEFAAGIPAAFYDADKALYPNMPRLSGSTQQQISSYLSARLALLDTLLWEETTPVAE